MNSQISTKSNFIPSTRFSCGSMQNTKFGIFWKNIICNQSGILITYGIKNNEKIISQKFPLQDLLKARLYYSHINYQNVFENNLIFKKTYTSIDEAFKYGSGVVFFTKNDRFLALSRHDDFYQIMGNEGFTLLNYFEVVEFANQQNKVKCQQTKESAKKAKELVKSYDNISNFRDGYYDEFPDAYGQCL